MSINSSLKRISIVLGVLAGSATSAFITVKIARAFTVIPGFKLNNIVAVAWKDNLSRTALFNAFLSGKNDWDATNTKIGFLYNNANPVVTINEVNINNGYNGFTITDTATQKANVNLNWFYLSAATETDTTRRGTAGHELGHSFGLGEAPTGSVLMNYQRNRTLVFVPTADDINGVNSIYGKP
jgi:hypothetical protein